MSVDETFTAAERMIAVPDRGIGAASEAVVEAARQAGYSVAATGQGIFRVVRSRRPRWAVVAAVVFAPLLGLGLLFLLVRRVDSGVISVFEDRSGTKVRVVGLADSGFLDVAFQSAVAGRDEAVAPGVVRVGVGDAAAAAAEEARPSGTWVPGPPAPIEPYRAPSHADSGDLPRGVPDRVEDLDRTMIRPQSLTAPARDPVLGFPDGTTLAVGSGVVVGRSPSASGSLATLTPVSYADPSLSKSHVAILFEDSGVAVIDLHSTNGTTVEAGGSTTRCAPGVAMPVPAGSVIHAGTCRIVVRESE